MRQALQAIQTTLRTKIGLGVFVATVVVFSASNYYLNEFYVIGVSYLVHLPVKVYVPYIIFTLINSVLVGCSVALLVQRLSLLRAGGVVKGGSVSMVGSFFGLLSSACPGCIAGFFPAVMAMIGYSHITLVGMKFYGLELQVISTILLLLGIYFLTRPLVCKVPIK